MGIIIPESSQTGVKNSYTNIEAVFINKEEIVFGLRSYIDKKSQAEEKQPIEKIMKRVDRSNVKVNAALATLYEVLKEVPEYKDLAEA